MDNIEILLEVWKDIPGYEGYQASNLGGGVRSLSRTVETVNGRLITRKGKLLKQRKSSNGWTVSLQKNGKSVPWYVHQLIALTFIGLPPDDKPIVLHGVKGRQCNDALNLRYGTHKENSEDTKRDGYIPSGRPVRRDDGVVFERFSDAARQAAVSIGNIRNACSGRSKIAGGHEWSFCGDSDRVYCLDGETWKNIPDYEDSHQASDLGRIRSVDRVTVRSNGSKFAVKGRILSQSLLNGYRHVTITVDGKYGHHYVHELVALTFIGPRPKGQQVRHGEKGSQCNEALNLSYGTRKENAEDRKRDGTDKNGFKRPVKRGDGVVFESVTEAAMKHGVTIQSIHKACTGLTKVSGGYEWSFTTSTNSTGRQVRRDDGKVFESAIEAAIEAGVTGCAIDKACLGFCKAGGHNWSYVIESAANKDRIRINTEKRATNKCYRSVKCSDGRVFKSLADAAREMEVSNTAICRACKGLIKTVGGFSWSYVTESQLTTEGLCLNPA